MGRPDRSTPVPRLFALLAIVLVAGSVGCASSAARVDQGSAMAATSAGVDYLRPVPTSYSARLTDVGDVSLLGNDTSMREALVAGDEDVVVAATLFREDSTYSLDLIVLNRRGDPIQLTRADLQLVAADGRWFEPVVDWPEGRQYGLRGRRSEQADTEVVYEVNRDIDREQALLLRDLSEPLGGDARGAKRNLRPTPDRRSAPDDEIERGASPELAAVDGSPSRVVVPPRDGRPFWGYFHAEDPQLPITAMVVVDGEQLLFRFDR